MIVLIQQMGLKEDVILVLQPIFGESVKGMLAKYYDNDHPDEIIELARAMLDGYMGPEMSRKTLQKVAGKYHINV